MQNLKKLLILTLAISCSQTNHHRSHINEKYLDPNCSAEEWNKGFQNSDKDTISYQKEILEHLPLKKGDSVADVGAGTGVFEAPLSRAVGSSGRIYAVDIAPAFIPFMKERFKNEGLKNVVVKLGEMDKTTLIENSIDLILVIDSYHHFEHPEKMLSDFNKILRKDGHLVVIDFKRGQGVREWILVHVAKDEEEYIEEITKNGFKFLRKEKIPFKESFQLTFQKK